MKNKLNIFVIFFSSIFIICLLLIVNHREKFNTSENYVVEVVYYNGEVDTLKYTLDSALNLDNGDLWSQGYGTLLSGVRKYKIISKNK